MFRQEEIGLGIPVFDRFETGFYFRKLHSLCLSAGLPYLIDLDDLIWELPDFSISSRIPPKYLLAFPESLISGAAALTVSTRELKEHVEHRYPGKPVFLVENCMPAWIAPRSGVLIANTDAFKMGDDQIGWFIDLLRLIFQHGLSIQLLGENQNVLERCSDIVVHSLPAMDYGSYLRNLAVAHFRLGLIPVEHSSYADCKSAIKAIEFISQRMPTVASDIAPYRRFAGLHGISDFQVVPNTFEAWKQAVETVILADPRTGTPEGKGDQRHAQDNPRHSTSAVARCCRFPSRPSARPCHDAATLPELRPYGFAYRRFRPIFMPIRNMLQKRS